MLEQIFITKKAVPDIEVESQKLDHVKCLKAKIKYITEANKIKTDIIKTLPEKQHAILNLKTNENISNTYESIFQAKSIGSITGRIGRFITINK